MGSPPSGQPSKSCLAGDVGGPSEAEWVQEMIKDNWPLPQVQRGEERGRNCVRYTEANVKKESSVNGFGDGEKQPFLCAMRSDGVLPC